ncbi:hypothetical protein FJZ53_03085 [Candidatus Woesearchaeota archaeon]|nr:hypothetical protein [Candidatus Woesearchaeota archaeon]
MLINHPFPSRIVHVQNDEEQTNQQEVKKMRTKILSIAVMVMFIMSMIPLAFAEEETTTDDTALETEPESTLQEIDSTNCWSDKPDYTPGVDKGFFIWQGTCGKFWWVDWSGDTRAKWKRWYKIVKNTEPTTDEPTSDEVMQIENQAAATDTTTLTAEETTDLQASGDLVSTGSSEVTGAQTVGTKLRDKIANTGTDTNIQTAAKVKTALKIKKPKLLYRVKGTITSNGQIFDVGLRKFDARDKLVYRPGKNVITFHGWVGPHFDRIFFRTTGDQVTFDLEFDGKKTTETVYIGKDKEHPATNPFTLTGEPATKKVCPVGKLIYEKKCTDKVAGIAVTPNGLAGSLADKEVPVAKGVAAGQLNREQIKARLQERLSKLPEKAQNRLVALNEKRLERLNKLEELKAKPVFENFKKELNFKARKLNQERIKEKVQNFERAREKFKQSRDAAKEAHQNFIKTKQELKDCTENCDELEAKTLEEAKTFLTNTADNLIEHLQQLKAKIESSEDISDSEAADMIAKIDAQIKELEDAKAKVTAATTKEEVKEASKTILNSWKRIRNHTFYHAAKLVAEKHGGIIVKMEHLSVRLQKVLEKMEENGKDTSTIQPLVDDFNSALESAKTSFEQAKAKFKEFVDLPEPKGEPGAKLLQEAQQYMKESRASLKTAQQKLKEIIKAVKDSKGSNELTSTTDEEAEDAEEAEDTEDNTETPSQ